MTLVDRAGVQCVRYTIRDASGREVVVAYAASVDEAMRMIQRLKLS